MKGLNDSDLFLLVLLAEKSLSHEALAHGLELEKAEV